MASTDRLYEEISRLKELRSKHLKDKNRYKKGFNILMECWDSIHDDVKPIVNKELELIGL